MLKERLVDYDEATGEMRSTPRQIFLETSSRCNLTCIHCQVDFGREDGPVKMDLPMATLRKLDPWLRAASFINLNYIGEPMVSPHFPEVLEICGRGAAEVSFNTNGLLLSERTCELLVETGVQSISVSIDGTHSMPAIRGVPYQAVADRVLQLDRVKRRLGSETPHVAIAFTLMRRNAYELPRIVRDLASRARIHAIHVQPLVIYNETLRDENVYRDEFALDAPDEARKAAASCGTEFVVFRSTAEDDERNEKQPDRGQLGQVSSRFGCVDPFFEIKIRSTGDVYACSYGRFPQLDINAMELDEVWNHEWYRELRMNLYAGRFKDECEHCPYVFGCAQNQGDALRPGVSHSREQRFLRGGYGRRRPPREAPTLGFLS